MRNILYYKGYTQYHNIGDQLINKSLLDYFRKYCEVIVSDAKMPEYYKRSLNILLKEQASNYFGGFHFQICKRAIFAVFQKNTRVYLLASPPGDQTTYSFVQGVKYFLSGLFYLFLSVLGVQLIKIGFSIGPLGRMAKVGERFRAYFIKHYFVRDSISLNFARGIGIKKAQIFPDLCWSYQPKIRRTEPIVNILDAGLPKIIFSFRNSVHSSHQSDDYENQLILLLSLFVKANKERFRFEIAYQVASDRSFCESIYERIKDFGYVSFIDHQIDLFGAYFYQSAKAVFTNRLHVGLLAAKFGCLPIMITDLKKHVKIRGIFQDAQIEHLLLDTSENQSVLFQKLDELLVDSSAFLTGLQHAEERYVFESEIIIKDIFK